MHSSYRYDCYSFSTRIDTQILKFGFDLTKRVLLSFRCAVDNTVRFNSTVDKRFQRFSLEAFKFLGEHQFVFLHCRVKICNARDPNSRCAQGCIRERVKRSSALSPSEPKDEEATLAEGPFMRKDEDEETRPQEIDKELRVMEKNIGG